MITLLLLSLLVQTYEPIGIPRDTVIATSRMTDSYMPTGKMSIAEIQGVLDRISANSEAWYRCAEKRLAERLDREQVCILENGWVAWSERDSTDVRVVVKLCNEKGVVE